jgi:hypothetical protein
MVAREKIGLFLHFFSFSFSFWWGGRGPPIRCGGCPAPQCWGDPKAVALGSGRVVMVASWVPGNAGLHTYGPVEGGEICHFGEKSSAGVI